MKSFVWFVCGVVVAVVAFVTVSRAPRGRDLLVDLDKGADEFVSAMKSEYSQHRTERNS